MHVIVCLDEKNGMLFGGRRQSKDKFLRRQALLLAGEGGLWMNGYSAGQFEPEEGPVHVCEDFLEQAPEDGWCFVENTDITPWISHIGLVAVYRWNRHYPSDTRFPVENFEQHWELLSSREFAGNSHERITEEVYRL